MYNGKLYKAAKKAVEMASKDQDEAVFEIMEKALREQEKLEAEAAKNAKGKKKVAGPVVPPMFVVPPALLVRPMPPPPPPFLFLPLR